jgi:PTS system ascorbate-specific IIB component
MKFLAVCSTGLGSSFMTHMNIEKALKELGVTGPADADAVFVGRDIAEAAQHLGDVVVLDSLIDMNEIRTKVAAAATRHGIEVPS